MAETNKEKPGKIKVEEFDLPKIAERTPWTPKGIWGHKNPVEMTFEEKERMLEKAKYSGPLATAYWENEIANHREKLVREEAAGKKQRAEELKEEIKVLIQETAKAKSENKQEEAEMNQGLVLNAKEELQEKKKGMGEKFKDGVKNAYNFFKKKLTGGEKKEQPEAPEAKEENKPEKEIINAEERGRKIEALKGKIRELREERYRRSRETGVIEQTKIEAEYAPQIKELEDEILELEKSGRKMDGKEVIGFLWERTKGFFGGFGWWEAHQAEKFRLGTKEAGRDLKIQAELLDLEDYVTFEEMGQAFKKTEFTGDSKESNLKLLQEISDGILASKVSYNKKVEDKMVNGALVKLADNLKNKSWVEEYKAANGGQVITPEKMREVEEKIRAEIGKLRKGQVKKDLVDFVKLSRKSLDKRWWSRYIYAGMDAVLAGLLLKWFVSKGVEKAVAEKTSEGVGKIAGGGAEKALEIGMKDHVWGETKRFLIEQGFSNPSDADIMKYAKMVAQDSEVAVKEWGLSGKILDTQMPAGYLLKFGRVAAELAKII